MPLTDFSAMIHNNGHLLCSIDLETTGLDFSKHDIVSIAIVPLNSQLFVLKHKRIKPFVMTLQPRRPENIDYVGIPYSRAKLAEMINTGIDSWRASDYFGEWFSKLELAPRKRIMPLGINWTFDRSFLIEWLGRLEFEHIFDGRYRDLMCTALFCNDVADMAVEQTPYPKVNLRYLASTLKVEHYNQHDALSDAVVTAECYRRMIHKATAFGSQHKELSQTVLTEYANTLVEDKIKRIDETPEEKLERRKADLNK